MKLYSLIALFGLSTAQYDGHFNFGPYRVDTKPMVNEMTEWNNWLGQQMSNPQTQQDAMKVGQGFAEAMNDAKMRLDVYGAQIFRPFIKNLKLYSEVEMLGSKCNYHKLYECWVTNGGNRESFSLRESDCAKAYNCQPDRKINYGNWNDPAYAEKRQSEAEFKRNIGTNAHWIMRNSARAMGKYNQEAMRLAQSFLVKAKDIAINVYHCDAECVNQMASHGPFNPMDIMGRCKCEHPISFNMPSSLLLKSPDMELYSLMDVQDDPEFKFDEQLEEQIMMLNKVEAQPAAHATQPQPAQPVMMPSKDEGGNNTIIVVSVLSAAFIVGAFLICRFHKGKKQEGENAERFPREKLI